MDFQRLVTLMGILNKPGAYLDPGSGSFILQVLLATLLASLFFVKAFWRKIIGVFEKPSLDEHEGEQDAEKSDEPGA